MPFPMCTQAWPSGLAPTVKPVGVEGVQDVVGLSPMCLVCYPASSVLPSNVQTQLLVACSHLYLGASLGLIS